MTRLASRPDTGFTFRPGGIAARPLPQVHTGAKRAKSPLAVHAVGAPAGQEAHLGRH